MSTTLEELRNTVETLQEKLAISNEYRRYFCAELVKEVVAHQRTRKSEVQFQVQLADGLERTMRERDIAQAELTESRQAEAAAVTANDHLCDCVIALARKTGLAKQLHQSALIVGETSRNLYDRFNAPLDADTDATINGIVEAARQAAMHAFEIRQQEAAK